MAPTLSEDDSDDLIYFARAGELGDLSESLEALCKREGCGVDEILAVAVDGESGNGVLHMAAANGHSGKFISPAPDIPCAPSGT